MTFDKAKELLLEVLGKPANDHNPNAARVILSEVHRTLGQPAVNQLIRELKLDDVFDFREGQSLDF